MVFTTAAFARKKSMADADKSWNEVRKAKWGQADNNVM